MNASSENSAPGKFPQFLVRISVATGAVSKVRFPGVGVGYGYPIGDDGTNIWLMNKYGIQRVDTATGRATTIAVAKEAQITTPATGPSAIANGEIYFTAGLVTLKRTGIVRIAISSGVSTVLSSPLLFNPNFVATSNGVVWAVNYIGVPREPVLVRVP
jgi:streptogramin lyase